MRSAIAVVALCLSTAAYGRTHHKTAGRSSATATSKTHHSSVSARRGRRGRGSHTQARASRARYQLSPTPERYSQIQQALASRGYYRGAVNGAWGADSVDALRRFQKDQKLDGDGKLTARSLGALGLGSKHAVAQVTPQSGSPSQITPTGSTPNDHRSPEGSQRP